MMGGVRRRAKECGVVAWAGEECGGVRRSGGAGIDGECGEAEELGMNGG